MHKIGKDVPLIVCGFHIMGGVLAKFGDFGFSGHLSIQIAPAQKQ